MSGIRLLIFLTCSLLLLRTASAQQDDKATAREYMTQAELILEATRALDDARNLMVTAAELDTTFIKANFQAGYMHLETINKSAAVKYLLRVFRQEPEYRFDLEFMIGKAYQYGLDFDKAIEFYQKYKDKLAKRPNYAGRDKVSPIVVDRMIYECNVGKELVANPKNYSIVNVGREINSEFDDYAPVLNEKEDELVFTTRRRDDNLNQNVYEDNLPFEDIFIARKNGTTWGFAKNIGSSVNTPNHDSNLALSADGKLLFIYKDDNGGDIYYCERQEDGTWGEAIPLPGIINSTFEEKSVSISKDEKTLYFASNRPGGYGGSDIYRATLDSKGNWSNVKNLGPKVNTEYDEEGPFIDYDNVTLYYSSKGLKGMGGYDIYKSVSSNNGTEWSEPENLGYPINTPDDDVYYIIMPGGKHAYYSSVRDDGLGYADIYVITQPEEPKPKEPEVAKEEPKKKDSTTNTPPVEITKNDPPKEEPKIDTKKEDPKKETPKKEPAKPIVPLRYVVTVIDAETKTPLDARIKMQGQKDNILLKSTHPSTGIYEFSITSKTPKDYRLTTEVDGYVFQNFNFKVEGATTEEKTLTRTIEMRKISVGVSSVLRNIYFDFDKATFKTESYAELNKLEAMLRQNANMVVEIGGHTDSYGAAAYNKMLSQKRAEAVKDFLTKKGIDPRRVTAVGYGESKPLASNDDEDDGRELNRRVEFRVLGN